MRSQAVVLGASMGGLLAARALANHYSKVTVVERDTIPAGVVARKGVPQGRHAHGLLASGAGVLERYFPGIQKELEAQGAVRGDLIRDSLWLHEGAFHTREGGGLEGLLLSRPLLEATVRKRLLALPNIELMERTDATGLAATPDRSQVQGVRLRRDGQDQTLQADMVVDATGRASHSAAWLHELGYPSASVDEVKVQIGYTTQVVRRKPHHVAGASAVILTADPVSRRGGVMLAIEDNRWIITMVGYFGNYAPIDPEGFLAFAKSLGSSEIYDVLRDTEPLTAPLAMRYPASRRSRYNACRASPKTTSSLAMPSAASIPSTDKECRYQRWKRKRSTGAFARTHRKSPHDSSSKPLASSISPGASWSATTCASLKWWANAPRQSVLSTGICPSCTSPHTTMRRL